MTALLALFIVSSSRAETSAALLARMDKKLAAFKTVEGSLQEKMPNGIQKVKFTAMRPNYLYVQGADYEVHGTGSIYFYYSPSHNTYMAGNGSSPGPAFLSAVLIGLEPVLGIDRVMTAEGDAHTETFQGKKALSAELHAESTVVRLYLDPKTLQPLGFRTVNTGDVAVYKDLRFGVSLTAKDFDWPLPPGATPMKGG